MQTGGPYALALNVATTVKPKNSQGAPFDRVVLNNTSPFTCQVNTGAPAKWLPAFTSDLYDVDLTATAELTVTPQLQLAGAGTDATLTATFYRAAEKIKGTYPTSLIAQAVVAAISGVVSLTPGTTVAIGNTPAVTISGTPTVDIAAGTVDIGSAPVIDIINEGGTFLLTGDQPATRLIPTGPGGLTWTTPAVPAGYKALVFTSVGANQATVTGVTTGLTYAYLVPVSSVTPTVVSIDPGSDAQYVITFTVNYAGQPTVFAFAQQPIPNAGLIQIATASALNPSGNAAPYVSLITTDTLHTYLLRSLRWTLMPLTATSAASDALLTIFTLGGFTSGFRDGCAANQVSETVGNLDFGEGLPLTLGAAAITITGNSGASGFMLVGCEATYEVR